MHYHKKKQMRKLLCTIFFLMGIIVFGQCPTTITATFNVTNSTCTNNGTITVNTNIPTGTTVTYTLYQVNPDNSLEPPVNQVNDKIFDNLEPSQYKIIVTCDSDSEDFFVTVGGSYTPISNVSATVSGVCTTFTAGGTINVTGITGGTAPYQISAILNTNPDYSDNLSQYTVTNVTSFPVNLPADDGFGTYQIRVKDACGAYFTISRDILKTIATPHRTNYTLINNTDCTTQQAGLSNFSFTDPSGSTIPLSAFGTAGVKVKIWEQTGSCPTTEPTTTPIFNQTITSSNASNTFNLPIVSSKKYVFALTSPCGETTIFCRDLNSAMTTDFTVFTTNSGCGAAETMRIRGSSNQFFAFPVTVNVYSGGTATGTPVYTSSSLTSAGALNGWSTPSSGLALGTYTVEYTDKCGVKYTKTVSVTKPADPANTALTANVTYLRNQCVAASNLIIDQTGTTQVSIEFTNYVENLVNSTVEIISGPNNVGQTGVFQGNRYFIFNELLPGGTYTVKVSSTGTGCSTTPRNYTFTIPPGTTGLIQTLTSTATSTCTGTGTVTSTINYNGGYTREVELLNASGTVIGTSTNGTFANLSAGNYTTRLKITPACDTSKTYYIEGSQVSIATSTSGPRILAKTGIICEDANGNPTSTGSVYLSLVGGSPRVLEYREQGTTTWTLFSSNAGDTEVVTGLTPYKTYEFKVTSCGKTFITKVKITVMRSIRVENTRQPCYNQSYTLVSPRFPGVTYEWKDPNGVVIGTNRNYYFPNYTSANDGTYTLTVKWGSCATRVATTVLNGNLCGQNLGGCYKDARTDGQILDTKHGITAFGRAGSDNSNWPMERKGGHTALESSTKGFVINRLTLAQISAIPTENLVEGMMVYDITNDCLKIYNGTEWKCFTDQTCPD